MIAAAFAVQSRPLFYFHAPSGSPEPDFLYEESGRTVIVESKATNGRATSMKHVLAHPQKYGTHKAVKFADTNNGEGKGFITYPLYALGFIEAEKAPQIIQGFDYAAITVPVRENI